VTNRSDVAPTSDDPRVIRSIAVSREDVVAAFEYNRRSEPRAVIRITPPFNGRMRARLHVDRGGSVSSANGTSRREGRSRGEPAPTDAAPIHVDPADLVAVDRLPAYPDPADTEDALRADPDVEYTPERHYERHVEAVSRWREAVGDAILDAVVVETPAGPHRVEVKTLG